MSRQKQLLAKISLALTLAASAAGCSVAPLTGTTSSEPLSGHCKEIATALLNNTNAINATLVDSQSIESGLTALLNTIKQTGVLLNNYSRKDFANDSDFELVNSTAKSVLALYNNPRALADTSAEPFSSVISQTNKILEVCSSVVDARGVVTFSAVGKANSAPQGLSGSYRIDWQASAGCNYSAVLQSASADPNSGIGPSVFDSTSEEIPASGTNYIYSLATDNYYVMIFWGGYEDSCKWSATFTPIN